MFFAVSVFFDNQRSDGTRGVAEEQIYLISAEDPDEAISKASELAKLYCGNYTTDNDITVTTKILGVDRAYPIETKLINGAEIFSRFIKAEEADSILGDDI